MSSTLQASVFIGNNYLEILHSIKNTGRDLTMKQMFDMSEKLIGGQSDEIYGVNTINWDDSSRKHLSLIGDEEVVSLSHAKVHVFSDSVVCFGKMGENPQSNAVWEHRLMWFRRGHHNTELWTQLMVTQWNSNGILSQDSPHCSSATKSESSCLKWAINQKNSQDGSSSCRCSTTSHWGSKDNEQECESSAQLVSMHAKRFSPGRWSFLGLGSEKKWYSIHDTQPQGEWDRVAELMMIKFSESGHPVFRSTSPLSRGVLKSKGGGTLSIRFCADEGTIETVFRVIISVNQLSIYGAVSDLCEEFKSCHVRTGRLVLVGQSDPLFVPTSSLMKTLAPSTEVLAQEDLLQKYQERVDKLSQQNRVIKFCTDAGFLTTVDVGQYFMTKDAEEFSQFTESVACREYTLPREDGSSQPRGWIQKKHQNWARVGSHNQLPTR